MKEGFERRIKGMLIGCAYGDAMGMPSEMMDEATFKKAFPEGIRDLMPSSPYDFIGRKFKAGEVTDDTINTLLVCDAIIQNEGEFDTVKYLSLLRSWISKNSDKNPYIMGPSTKKALEAIESGMPIDEAGRSGTTNGSVMKVSPIGIISDLDHKDILIKNVKALCLPTHNTKIAISGACVIASIVSYVIHGGTDITEIWDIADEIVDMTDCEVLRTRIDEVRKILRDKGDEAIGVVNKQYGAGMETIETVPMVMLMITVSDLDPKKAALLSANLYGDTDTIGSISTAICGASGKEIGEEATKTLIEVNGIDFDHYANELAKYIK